MDNTIIDFLDKAIKNDGIFQLNVKNDWYAQKLRKENSLPKWRSRMASNFLQDYEAANVFGVSIRASEGKAERISKEAIRQQDDDWVMDVKKLMNIESIDELKALKKMIEVITDHVEKSPEVVIQFLNEYDRGKRIYLGMSIRDEVNGNVREVDVPEAENILRTTLSDWQKRYAKDLRAMGRYSFSIITARDLYGARETFKMLEN